MKEESTNEPGMSWVKKNVGSDFGSKKKSGFRVTRDIPDMKEETWGERKKGNPQNLGLPQKNVTREIICSFPLASSPSHLAKSRQ